MMLASLNLLAFAWHTALAYRHRISRAQVYKEIASGQLVASKLGKRTLITREAAADWRMALTAAILSPLSSRST
jgi:hypothetical protein